MKYSKDALELLHQEMAVADRVAEHAIDQLAGSTPMALGEVVAILTTYFIHDMISKGIERTRAVTLARSMLATAFESASCHVNAGRYATVN